MILLTVATPYQGCESEVLAKEPYKSDYSAKETYILMILLTVATPYQGFESEVLANMYSAPPKKQMSSSLLQNSVSFIGLCCKRDLQFNRSY